MDNSVLEDYTSTLMDVCVVLQVNTYAGYCPGASHYYGELRARRTEQNAEGYVELKHKLSAEEAKELNKYEKDSSLWHYKRGDTTQKFFSYEQVLAEAKRRWRKDFPDAVVLFEGSYGVYDPQPVLDGPKWYKQQVNAFVKEMAGFGGWSNEKKMHRVAKLYHKLNKKLIAEKICK